MRSVLLIVWCVLCLLFAAAPASAGSFPTLERISIAERSDGLGFVVRLHSDGIVHAYMEPVREERTLEWRIFHARLSDDFRNDAETGPVRRLTVEQEGEHVRVRLELSEEAKVQIAAYRDGLSDDLLLSLRDENARPARLASTSSATGGGREEAELVTLVSAAAEKWKLDTIVLDAGHGGHDPGTRGNGLREKEIVLDVTLKIGKLLEKQLPDVDIVYTRTEDEFVELRQRGRIANQANGKLFVSIHANGVGSPHAKGTETFFLGMHKTEAARSVMERENSVVKLESDPSHYAQLDEQALILQTLARSSYMRMSEELAGLVQTRFERKLPMKSRGVKQAGFMVLWGASMPSILVELGFVTNPDDARVLGSASGRSKLADSIANAIVDFKAQYEADLDIAAEK